MPALMAPDPEEQRDEEQAGSEGGSRAKAASSDHEADEPGAPSMANSLYQQQLRYIQNIQKTQIGAQSSFKAYNSTGMVAEEKPEEAAQPAAKEPAEPVPQEDSAEKPDA